MENCGNCEHYRSEVNETTKSGAISVRDEGHCRRFPDHVEVGVGHSCAEFDSVEGGITGASINAARALAIAALTKISVGQNPLDIPGDHVELLRDFVEKVEI